MNDFKTLPELNKSLKDIQALLLVILLILISVLFLGVDCRERLISIENGLEQQRTIAVKEATGYEC